MRCVPLLFTAAIRRNHGATRLFLFAVCRRREYVRDGRTHPGAPRRDASSAERTSGRSPGTPGCRGTGYQRPLLWRQSAAGHHPGCPLHFSQTLVGYAGALPRDNDVGGIVPRSMPGEVTEIFQEGHRTPPIAAGWDWGLSPAGRDLIAANSRLPAQRVADLYAQESALRTAQTRLSKLCEEYGVELVATQCQ